MDLIGLPLTLAISAAAPADEPKSSEPALRNSSALFDPADITHRMAMPSLANSVSSSFWSLRTRLTGLYVAQSTRISSTFAARTGRMARLARAAAPRLRRLIEDVTWLLRTFPAEKSKICRVGKRDSDQRRTCC